MAYTWRKDMTFRLVGLLYMILPVTGSLNLEEKLSRSLHKAMNCNAGYKPDLPVIAFSTRRLMQAIAAKRHMQNAHDCVTGEVKSGFLVSKPRTWHFCVLGLCADKQCRCPLDVTGKNCAIYTKKCWLVFCFLQCEQQPGVLQCYCDPFFYGKHVQGNDYWYNSGLVHHYLPPPVDWKDDEPYLDDRRIIVEIVSDLNDYQFDLSEYSHVIEPPKKVEADFEVSDEELKYQDNKSGSASCVVYNTLLIILFSIYFATLKLY